MIRLRMRVVPDDELPGQIERLPGHYGLVAFRDLGRNDERGARLVYETLSASSTIAKVQAAKQQPATARVGAVDSLQLEVQRAGTGCEQDAVAQIIEHHGLVGDIDHVAV